MSWNGMLSFLLITSLIVNVVLFAEARNQKEHKIAQAQSDQEQVTRAARLVIQSTTQEHPLFQLEHIQQAKLIIEQLQHKYGSIQEAQDVLGVPELERLVGTVQVQYRDTMKECTQRLITHEPQFNFGLNREAGLL